MVVLVDAKYFGKILRCTRKNQNMKTKDLAKMFHISVRQWHRYECGKEPIPENILITLFTRGFCMLRCKMN